MPANTKTIKRRIKSVTNTKKITKAMEMVAAAKMRKAVERVLGTRMYATLARDLLEHLGQLDMPEAPLLQVRPVRRLLTVVIASDRGLCGSFNSSVLKQAHTVLSDTENVVRQRGIAAEDLPATGDFEIDVIGIGRKSAQFAKKHGYNLIGVYDGLSSNPRFDDILTITKMIIDGYREQSYDKVIVAYTDYKSSLVQEAKVRQLMPVAPLELKKMLAQFNGEEVFEENEKIEIENYLFEPDADAIIEEVLPRLVEIQLYQALLESVASEHSARMLAMKSASDAAGDMIDELNLSYNKARQAAITQEIAEIAGGAAALE